MRLAAMRDHQRKLGRAHDHLKEIEEAINGWLDSDNYVTVHEYDRGTQRYRIYVDTKSMMNVLDPVPLLIGDYLHNLRSGLDHLALELAASHTTPLTDKLIEDSEFPIFGDED